MRVHPVVSHLSGVVTVSLQAQFIGEANDTPDRAKIQSYGDPIVNLGGTFTDPGDPLFSFSTGSAVVQTGITQGMQSMTAQFMTTLPAAIPGKPAPVQGPLDIITPDPARAALIWRNELVARITVSVNNLRAQSSPLTTLPDATV